MNKKLKKYYQKNQLYGEVDTIVNYKFNKDEKYNYERLKRIAIEDTKVKDLEKYLIAIYHKKSKILNYLDNLNIPKKFDPEYDQIINGYQKNIFKAQEALNNLRLEPSKKEKLDEIIKKMEVKISDIKRDKKNKLSVFNKMANDYNRVKKTVENIWNRAVHVSKKDYSLGKELLSTLGTIGLVTALGWIGYEIYHEAKLGYSAGKALTENYAHFASEFNKLPDELQKRIINSIGSNSYLTQRIYDSLKEQAMGYLNLLKEGFKYYSITYFSKAAIILLNPFTVGTLGTLIFMRNKNEYKELALEDMFEKLEKIEKKITISKKEKRYKDNLKNPPLLAEHKVIKKYLKNIKRYNRYEPFSKERFKTEMNLIQYYQNQIENITK